MEGNESASKKSQKNRRKDRVAVKVSGKHETTSSDVGNRACHRNGNDIDAAAAATASKKSFGFGTATTTAPAASDDEDDNEANPSEEPVYEEDIIDGFAFISFITYEDLQNTIKTTHNKSEESDANLKEKQANHKNNNVIVNNNVVINKNGSSNNNVSEDSDSLTSFPGESKKSNKNNNTPPRKLKKLNHNKNVPKKPVPPDKIKSTILSNSNNGLGLNENAVGTNDDNCWSRLTNQPVRCQSRERFSDTSSRASSGRGYMCDSESEDDRASDVGFDTITSNIKPNHLGSSGNITPVATCSAIALSLSPSNITSAVTSGDVLIGSSPQPATKSCSSVDVSAVNSHSPHHIIHLQKQQQLRSGRCSISPPHSLSLSSSLSPPPPLLVANSHIRHPNPPSADNKCPPPLTPPFLSSISPVIPSTVTSSPSPSIASAAVSSTPPICSSNGSGFSRSAAAIVAAAAPSRTSNGLQQPRVPSANVPSSSFSACSSPLLGFRTNSVVNKTTFPLLASSSSLPSSNVYSGSGLSLPSSSSPSPSLSSIALSRSPSSTSSICSSIPVTCSHNLSTSKSRTSTSTSLYHPAGLVKSTNSTQGNSSSSSTSANLGSTRGVVGELPVTPISSSTTPSSSSSSSSPLLLPSSVAASVAAAHQQPSVPPPPHGMFAHPPQSHLPQPSSSSVPGTSHTPTNSNLASGRDSLFSPSNQQDMLRRELDSRFLASHDRSINIPPPPYMRTEMHQHQHTHLHQHNHMTPSPNNVSSANTAPSVTPSGVVAGLGNPLLPQPSPHLFDKFSKLDSPFHRPGAVGQLGLSPFTTGLSPLVAPGNPASSSTPFSTPSQLAAFQPKLPAMEKSKSIKAGKWNAMHVRIAWEIYNHQQKPGGDSQKSAKSSSSEALLRPPSHLFPSLHSRPMDIPPFSASALLGAASGHSRNPFDAATSGHPSMFLSPNASPLGLAAFPRPGFPLGVPANGSFGGLGSLGSGLLGNSRDLPSFAAGMEQWNRLLRTPGSFPTPPPPAWHMKNSDPSAERDSLLKKPMPNTVGPSDKDKKDFSNKTRDMLEREREKQRDRDRESRLLHTSTDDSHGKDFMRNGLISDPTNQDRHARDRERDRSREASRSPIRNNSVRDFESMKNSRNSSTVPHSNLPAALKLDSAFNNINKIPTNNLDPKHGSSSSKQNRADLVHKVKQERKDDDVALLPSQQRTESHALSASTSSDIGSLTQHRLHGHLDARTNHSLAKDNNFMSRPSSSSSSSTLNMPPASSSSVNIASLLDRGSRMLNPLGLRVPPPHGLGGAADRPHSFALWDLYRSNLEYNPLAFIDSRERELHERELMHRFGNQLPGVASPMMLPHGAIPPRFRQDMDSAAIMRELERSKQMPPSAMRTNDPSYFNSVLPPSGPRNSITSPLLNSLGRKSNSPLANSLTMGPGPPPLIPSATQNHNGHHQRPSPINNLLHKYSNSPGMLDGSIKDPTKRDNLNNHELEHQSR